MIPENIKNHYCLCCNKFKKFKESMHQDDDFGLLNDEYDCLKREIEQMEELYPNLTDEDSPVHFIGGRLKSYLKPVDHVVKMESLKDSFTLEEIEKFHNRVSAMPCMVEPKIDGISLSVVYKNSILFSASTRGNGFVGEDVTENVKKIKNIPLKISSEIPLLEVRGEVFIPKKKFYDLMQNYKEIDGTKPFSNSRNAAAGIMRGKDSKLVESFHLEILFFNLQRLNFEKFSFLSPGKFYNDNNEISDNLIFTTHSDTLNFMKNLSLPVVDSYFCKDFNDISEKILYIEKTREDFNFQIDGSVIKVNDLFFRQKMGSTDTSPRWAQAFKYHAKSEFTKVSNIENNISRNGIITPVAHFEPVNISETVITKATMHNYDYLFKEKIKNGSIVKIIKAGDVIPKISALNSVELINNDIKLKFGIEDIKFYNDSLPDFKIPKKCPSCSSLLVKKENEVSIKCVNKKCKIQVLEKFLHFSSRNAMNIKGLGKSILLELIEKNLLFDFEDLYKLDAKKICDAKISLCKGHANQAQFFDIFYESLLNSNGKKILKEIKKSLNQDLSNFLYALGIPFIGKEAANVLSRNFSDFKSLLEASFEYILNLDGFGNTSAQSLYSFLKEENLSFFEPINFKSKFFSKK